MQQSVRFPGRPLLIGLGALSMLALAGVGVQVFAWAPLERYMGISQKLMYVHVPSIYVAYLAFGIVFVCSLGYLWGRGATWDRLAYVSAEIGLLFGVLSVFSGALWGKLTWNAYWVWDARMTTTLVLLLIYAGYVLFRAFAPPGERQARLAAVLGIIGFLDVPLIHVSVQWWRTLHQPSSVFRLGLEGVPAPSMPAALLWPLWSSLAAVSCFFAFLVLLRFYVIHLETRSYE